MFKSATVKLTAWYLLLLMLLSVVFSSAIYHLASVEIHNRLDHFQMTMQRSQGPKPLFNEPGGRFDVITTNEQEAASSNLALSLVYVNLFVLFAGGFLSYYLARRHLRPIEKTHEAQSRFTSDASHELRTPLAVMRTEIEVAIKDKDATNEELREVLQSNLEEVKKLTKLSEMLLDLSRMDNAKLDMKPVKLNELANEIANSFRLPSNRITVKTDREVIARGNEVALGDAMRVLIDNALQYSPDSSIVTVAVSKSSDVAKFEVTNFGSGIDQEKLPHIFERFYRADSSRTNGPTKGYGLGLALAKKIIDLHNGTISAESVPDKQTKFTITLPFLHRFKAKNKK